MTLDADITNELHTQIQYQLIEKLSESERRYRELVESLQEIVFKCDAAGHFTFLNRAWTQTLGFDVAVSLDRPLVNFLHPDDRDQGSQLLVRLQKQQVVIGQELRFVDQTGVLVWLELSTHPSNQNERSGSLTNITDRKCVEAALQCANEALEMRVEELKQAMRNLQLTQAQLVQTEKMSSLGQLVAGVAHEINNPVSFIHGNMGHVRTYAQDLLSLVQLYQKHHPNPIAEIQAKSKEIDLPFLQHDLDKVLDSMKIGTDRICQIVLSLRNFSRMDESEFKTVDIHEGIDSTLMILQHRLKACPGRLSIEVMRDYAKLPLVECYPGQLNQVLMNLLTNAIDALEDTDEIRTIQDIQNNPSRITIRTGMIDHEWVEISIADNGPSIPEKVKERIFDPFFTTKPIGKGTGIGLSISYQIIIEKHGGKLECLSNPNQGTEFVIQIPIQQQAFRFA